MIESNSVTWPKENMYGDVWQMQNGLDDVRTQVAFMQSVDTKMSKIIHIGQTLLFINVFLVVIVVLRVLVLSVK